ncbi:MAG: MFS transporter [Reichenbachiella sp.]
MTSLHKNVYVLTFAQALMMSAGSMIVFVGGIVGADLAPSPSLATLPVASIIIGSAISSVPVALLMKKFGRKSMFLSISLLATLMAMLASYAITISSFYLLCFAFSMIGIGVSGANQFRFAAMESVKLDLAPKAASTVLLGGIASAFIGPEIAVLGKNLFEQSFAGSFVLLGGLFSIGLILLIFYENSKIEVHDSSKKTRSLKEIAQNPIFWVAVLSAMTGYAVMSFIMTATPVSMHVVEGHALHHTKWVIQSHIVAMFLPSLITPWISSKIGINKLIITGLAIFAICILIALLGREIPHYWVSLVLLGIGWNFLFIGGTSLLPQSHQTHERFKVQALNEFMVFGTQAIASLSAGFVVFQFGWNIVLLLMIPALIIPLIPIIYIRVSKQKS